MKSAEEWVDKHDYNTHHDENEVSYHALSIEVIKQIQLDAWKQGMLDATQVLYNTYGKRAASPRQCEETILAKINSQSRE